MRPKFFSVLLLFCFILTSVQCKSVRFDVADSTIVDKLIRKEMEKNLSNLLSEINQANTEKRDLNYNGINIDSIAASNLTAIWRNIHFSIDDTATRLRCLSQVTGYQVREINITLNPLDPSFEESRQKELSVSFSKEGTISGVRLALNPNTKATFFEGTSIEDSMRRLEILAFIEDFHNYYIEKNIDALKKIYADNVWVKHKATNSIVEANYLKGEYHEEDKQQYITRLSNDIFVRYRYINVDFDHITIERCGTPGKTNYYGVNIHQNWAAINNSAAKDSQKASSDVDGWLFMLWEFKKDDPDPIIHVRTWQPDEIILNDDSKVSMHDFKF